MKRFVIWVLGVFLCLIITGFLLVTYQQADDLVHSSLDTRTPAKYQPNDFDLKVSEVVVFNAEGQKLHGYFSPTANGAYVMLQHGFKANRGHMLEEAKILQERMT